MFSRRVWLAMPLAFPQHMASGSSLPHPTAAQRVKPGPGQLSVWEAPFTRPPSVRDVRGKHVVLRVGEDGPVILESTNGVQICETSHPPTWYFPQEDIRMGHLRRIGGATMCEFKGRATYFDIMAEPDGASNPAARALVPQGAWTYDRTDTTPIEGRVAFYLRPPLVAHVDGERAAPQEGDFYGGWITSDVVGPFKGGTGTRFW
ncbi:hypothetical protein KFE25_001831 [Diacronema lutheri]|uniref:DUF427 domain-containing protein n=1 Tax=Diacronema lutheri TaxID=2081491 RepID=A0A8J6CD11_DIALT|nr:hypothetical protein KFE25_001831 [Diacronema lutheri]